eukprot:TRINITY_DN1874_c0_g1_i3.p1 TRINITY_DN1874_c0_g1~~TRINITY_DN1874_c0_g1_i3.p1  ORF type:complete len:656 (-),score=158.71 TRINITY_DN1874_c0_g1_i3:158-2125(-)
MNSETIENSSTHTDTQLMLESDTVPAKSDSNALIEESKESPVNDSMFIIRDKTTGAVYDIRSQEFCFGMYIDPSSVNDSQEKCEKLNLQLLRASEIGDLEEAKNTLEPIKNAGWIANINVKDLCDFTPLHNAVGEGHTHMAKFFLEKGASINAVTESGRTPLHLACYNGNKEIIELLLANSADINLQDDEGNTPAHILAECGWTECLSLLLKRGPDMRIKNKCGQTPPKLSANVEIQKLLSSFDVGHSTGYSRTIIDNMVLHNNRADMIKERMFKARFLEMAPGKQESISPPKESLEASTHERENRRMKLLEAARKISSTILPSENPKQVGPEDFQLIKQLGKGSFGHVFLVKHKCSGRLYAMKALSKAKFLSHNLLKYAKAERDVMTRSRHPFIVALHYAFQTSNKLVFILDYCPGYYLHIDFRGDLGKMLRREKVMGEDRARLYLGEVLLALEFLHARDIIFRDLKPENVVLDRQGHAMLTDFGLSKEGVTDSTVTKTFCGSRAYLAPEIISKSGHNKAVDWYLFGLMMYEMLVGSPPYYSSDRQQYFKNVKSAPLRVPKSLSANAKDLIQRLLDRNPSTRLGAGPNGANDIKHHPWFKKMDWKKVIKRELKMPKPTLQPIESTQESIDFFTADTKKYKKVDNWTVIQDDSKV